MRIAIVQYAGHYAEAWHRLNAGGPETYQAQRYSVDHVGSLVGRAESVTTICALGDSVEDDMLGNGVRAICAGLSPGFAAEALIPWLEKVNPDRLILRMPSSALVRWAARRRLRTIAIFADSFRYAGLRSRLRHWRLRRALSRPSVEWVANHGLNACLSLASIGVSTSRIVPWDWPATRSPHDVPPKLRDSERELRLYYAGVISASKGVGDLLEALALLRNEGRHVSLSLAGSDSGGAMAARATRLGLDDATHFLGLVANDRVRTAMRDADAVVIPSRHDYPEGLPLTIYEALAARTPIIASDHPMFRGALSDGDSAVIFAAASPPALAAAIRRLDGDEALYARLSANAGGAWDALQLPVHMGELIDRWLTDDAADTAWIADHGLASGRYDRQIERWRM